MWEDKKEWKFPLSFLGVLIILGSILYFPENYSRSTRVAAMGGTLAFLGVVFMALPVLRVGPLQWISNTIFEDVMLEMQRKETLTHEEMDDLKDQRIRDLMIQNIYGPYMIGIGTFINGFSGFF